MADVSIMKEFLVSLGFKVDEAKLKRFGKAVTDVTKRVAEVGVAIEAAAAAVEAGVVKIASQFDQMYYASQRLRSTVGSIQAFTFGISQAGGTAAGATASLEALAARLRQNPGYAHSLKSFLGADALDVNGQLKQTTGLMDALADKFRKMTGGKLSGMGYAHAYQQAQLYGIDEPTLIAMINGYKQYSDEVTAFGKRIGLNMDQGAAGATKFMKGIRTLRMEFGLLVDKIGLDLMSKYGPKFQQFLIWVSDNAPMIEQRLEHFGDGVVQWGLKIAGFAKTVYDFFKNLDTATGGLSTNLLLIGAAIKMSGLGELALSLLALNPELIPIAAGIAAIAASFALLSKTGNLPTLKGELSGISGDFKDLWGALKEIGQDLAPVLGPAISAFVNGSLTQLHRGLRVAIDELQQLHAAFHGDWTGVVRLQGQIAQDRESMIMAPFQAGADAAKQYLTGRSAGSQKLGDLSSITEGVSKSGGASDAKSGAGHGGGDFGKAGALGVQTGDNTPADATAADTDPDSQPRTAVRTMRTLNDSLLRLVDAVGNGTFGQGASPGGAVLQDASYVRPDNDNHPLLPAVVAAGSAVAGLLQGGGLSAMVAQGVTAALYSESGLNINAQNKQSAGSSHATGIAQWLAQRQKLFAQEMGEDIHGSSLQDQISFILYELKHTRYGQQTLAAMNQAQSTGEAGSAFLRFFERPGAAGMVADTRRMHHYLGHDRVDGGSRGPVSITARADININGARDPHAVAQETAFQQRRVHADWLRNAENKVA